MKIGIISDTHGYLHHTVIKHFSDVDEIWHAGDVGPGNILGKLEELAPVRAVYGNIDDDMLRREVPKTLNFYTNTTNVLLTHIGGYPGKYAPGIRQTLNDIRPNLFVCGHSHILKVQYDKNLQCLHINPGSAGLQGFHQVCTIIKLVIDDKIRDLEIIEFPRRGAN
ncbi:MAG: metallophosphoesterase family protein [Salinivirgaceae bacterium]|jgi:putative phosphoesterase|nr:metallophosphoesterase family protein [Salinivirgaceae bacterium]